MISWWTINSQFSVSSAQCNYSNESFWTIKVVCGSVIIHVNALFESAIFLHCTSILTSNLHYPQNQQQLRLQAMTLANGPVFCLDFPRSLEQPLTFPCFSGNDKDLKIRDYNSTLCMDINPHPCVTTLLTHGL